MIALQTILLWQNPALGPFVLPPHREVSMIESGVMFVFDDGSFWKLLLDCDEIGRI